MSNPNVTITLGRTGQVVRRGRVEDGRSDPRSSSRSQRSLRERLGVSAESHSLSKNKRMRGNGNAGAPVKGVNGTRIGRNDLRFKLMRKRQSTRTHRDVEERKRTDLRQRLPRTSQSSQNMNMVSGRNELKESSYLRQRSPIRSSDDFLLDSRRAYSHSPWEAHGLRSRSPDRIFQTSGGLSPPRISGELRPVPSMRPIDESRTRQLLSNGALPPPRPPVAVPVPMRAALENKSLPARLPPVNGTMPSSSYVGEEPRTVHGLLESLGLMKYLINFRAEEVDMPTLRQMGDIDLKEMGIPMGPRKKILLAIRPRSRQQPP